MGSIGGSYIVENVMARAGLKALMVQYTQETLRTIFSRAKGDKFSPMGLYTRESGCEGVRMAMEH
jgi:hypothetical protein